jgi:hypothetical protein
MSRPRPAVSVSVHDPAQMVRVLALNTSSSVCTSTWPPPATMVRAGVWSRKVTPSARAREVCAELARRMSSRPDSAW